MSENTVPENPAPENSIDNMRRVRTDPLFYAILGTIGGTYVLLIVAMLLATAFTCSRAT